MEKITDLWNKLNKKAKIAIAVAAVVVIYYLVA